MGQLGQLTMALVVIAISAWIVAVVTFAARRGAARRITSAAQGGQPAATAQWPASGVPAPAREPARQSAAEPMWARRVAWPGRDADATTHGTPDDRAERAGAATWRPLTEADRDRYEAAWRGVQAVFVHDPRAGIDDADRLVANVLRARGDPSAIAAGVLRAPVSRDGRLSDAAARYAAGHYPAARRDDPTVAPTELWQAMTDYPAAIDALLEPEPTAHASVPDRTPATRSS
jgi:hypothetical protein